MVLPLTKNLTNFLVQRAKAPRLRIPEAQQRQDRALRPTMEGEDIMAAEQLHLIQLVLDHL